jgi:hypothetical protein
VCCGERMTEVVSPVGSVSWNVPITITYFKVVKLNFPSSTRFSSVLNIIQPRHHKHISSWPFCFDGDFRFLMSSNLFAFNGNFFISGHSKSNKHFSDTKELLLMQEIHALFTKTYGELPRFQRFAIMQNSPNLIDLMISRSDCE